MRTQAEARSVIAAEWPNPDRVRSPVYANEIAGPARTAAKSSRSTVARRQRPSSLPPRWRRLRPSIPQVKHAPRRHHARRGGRAAGRQPRLRLWTGCGRPLRQRFPACCAPSSIEYRRAHPQLAALRERDPRRLCRIAALAGMRPIGEIQFNDFVATGLQPAGQQRGQDPVSLGRFGAHGRAHAVGWIALGPAPITARTRSRGSIARRA